LVDTLALTISIAIDPHALAGAPVPPQEDASPSPESTSARHVEEAPAPALSTTPAEQPPPPPKSVRARVSRELYANLRASLGTQPGVAPGVALGGALGWSMTSVGLELFGHLPTSMDVPSGGTVRGWLIGASLVPCFRLGIVRVCALGTVGRFEGSGSGVAQPETHAAPFVALGGRTGIELPVGELLTVGIHGDLQVNLDPTSLRVGPADVWTASPVVGVLAASGGVIF
jgi:hypothetical protein